MVSAPRRSAVGARADQRGRYAHHRLLFIILTRAKADEFGVRHANAVEDRPLRGGRNLARFGRSELDRYRRPAGGIGSRALLRFQTAGIAVERGRGVAGL